MKTNSTAKAIELLGEAKPVSRQSKKETVMSFRRGPLHMGLKLVAPFSKEQQSYGDPVPKIVFLVDGKYVRMPLDGRLFGEFGKFLSDLSEVVEGIAMPSVDGSDIDTAKAKMAAFRGSL